MTSASTSSTGPHFTLTELTFSSSHPLIPNAPSLEALTALEVLVTDFLEPVRAKFGPLVVHSAYRGETLNRLVGGVPTSAHCFGAAADFTVAGVSPNDLDKGVTAIVRWIVNESGLSYDQVIDESAGGARWCHLGTAYPLHTAPRKQAFIYNGRGYTVFKP